MGAGGALLLLVCYLAFRSGNLQELISAVPVPVVKGRGEKEEVYDPNDDGDYVPPGMGSAFMTEPVARPSMTNIETPSQPNEPTPGPMGMGGGYPDSGESGESGEDEDEEGSYDDEDEYDDEEGDYYDDEEGEEEYDDDDYDEEEEDDQFDVPQDEFGDEGFEEDGFEEESYYEEETIGDGSQEGDRFAQPQGFNTGARSTGSY